MRYVIPTATACYNATDADSGLAGWNAPNPLISQRSKFCLPGLFKPHFASRPAAAGEEQIPISVEELDRASPREAVGGGELYRFGSFTSP